MGDLFPMFPNLCVLYVLVLLCVGSQWDGSSVMGVWEGFQLLFGVSPMTFLPWGLGVPCMLF